MEVNSVFFSVARITQTPVLYRVYSMEKLHVIG